jgi:hypothetical protein
VTEACYVYAVVPPDAEPPPLKGIVPGSAVEVLPFRPLAALVSRVPAELFDSESAACRTCDPEWMADRIAAHHAVVASVGPCLPMAFGVLFSDLGLVQAWLASRATRLQTAMQKAAQQTEWALLLQEDTSEFSAWTEAHDPELRRFVDVIGTRGQGTAFLLARRLDKIRQAARQRCLDTAAARVNAWAQEAAMGLIAEPVRGGLPSWTVLLPNDRPDALSSSLPTLSASLPGGLSVRVSGPWPAYAYARSAVAGRCSCLILFRCRNLWPTCSTAYWTRVSLPMRNWSSLLRASI